MEVELGTGTITPSSSGAASTRSTARFPTTQTPTLKIQAYDPSMKMGLKKRNRTFADMALSDMVATVASAYFTSIDVNVTGDPSFPGNGLRQQEETDLAFLRRLASTYGCILYVTAGDQDDTFHFISQSAAMSMASAVTVYYGRSDVDNRLLSFQASVDAIADRAAARALGHRPRHREGDRDRQHHRAERGDQRRRVLRRQPLRLRVRLPRQGRRARRAPRRRLHHAGGPARRARHLGARRRTPTFTTEASRTPWRRTSSRPACKGCGPTGARWASRQIVAQTNIDIGDVGAASRAPGSSPRCATSSTGKGIEPSSSADDEHERRRRPLRPHRRSATTASTPAW